MKTAMKWAQEAVDGKIVLNHVLDLRNLIANVQEESIQETIDQITKYVGTKKMGGFQFDPPFDKID